MTFVMRKGLQKGRSRPQHLVFAVWHSNNLQADRKAFMKAARDGNGRKSQPVEHHGVRRINGREIGVWLPAIGILPGSIPIGNGHCRKLHGGAQKKVRSEERRVGKELCQYV